MKHIATPGKIIRLRGRRWIVMPSPDKDLLLAKPLGGTDDEITGIFLPLQVAGDKIEEDTFPEPTVDDLGDFSTARLMFDASRLSFRNASGPFRCTAKLSFRPRSYQIVPLVMALKQDVTRLLIADDVGIGKTVEALIILKELMERGEIKRFAVICLPHLCEQWQKELKDKLDIEAEIIRSSTVASLERKLPGDGSVFQHYPYQVISIDYIKSERKKNIFLNDCPEFVIVDEAHTCAKPKDAKSPSQQQRYHLLHQIAKNEQQHLLLLTATPHSGKDEEFLSLLGLLKPEFEKYSLDSKDQTSKRKIARHFIQRKRENIKRWLKEVTPFPERESVEVGYKLSPTYANFYNEVYKFARGLTQGDTEIQGARGKYWAALGLLRGIMSSPQAGYSMLQSRMQKVKDLGDELLYDENPVIEKLESDSDHTLTELLDQTELTSDEQSDLKYLAEEIEKLFGIEKDKKVATAHKIVADWLKEGYNPIIFCKYIETAKYVGEILKAELPKSVLVQTITSELPDEQRKEIIETMKDSPKRVLVATDCLSEGINLQDAFNSILHYDLPWNPNRIEQREGRVDRYGQRAATVKTYMVWGEDNPIDAIVLKVLIRKVRDIQRSTGVSISLGEDNRSIMDAVLKEVLLDPRGALAATQQQIDFGDAFSRSSNTITTELEEAKRKAENLRSIFAHESVKPEEIEADLRKVDEAIGDVQSVEHIVRAGVVHLGGKVEADGPGYKVYTANLPVHLRDALGGREIARVSFDSPTPEGYRYIGRNHNFVEQLCQFLLSLAFEEKGHYSRIARSAVIKTANVSKKTTLIQFRVRNVIKEVNSKNENISEEMYLWGYAGSGADAEELDYTTCKQLLFEAQSTVQLSPERQAAMIENEKDVFTVQKPKFLQLAEQRAEALVEAHGQFKKLVGGRSYEAVHPVLPPDILGVYVFIP
ncbi:helicase-related protein [Pontibacter sp. BAB1700]|uniref:helicase-related protein n=1 Tax=Pontibacter sp. BAB1700 TaxID=1144253 RepID=UPI00026BE0B1|nr:helicase-related protein [Pontibacter sp. BAB1700]EJF10769.1 helicase [Pontibacter sp. BAB1700]